MKPFVTVLMPVYNAEKYLAEAIESILNQTYKNFDFLIINDGSTDSSIEIIQDYAKKNNRIKIISRENKGLIATLNEGLDIIDTKYIARMDADDISLPRRLEEQIKFMEENPKIAISGANAKSFGRGLLGSRVIKVPQDYESIKLRLCFESALLHPTVIFRQELFKKHNLCYRLSDIHAEDYGLWVDTSKLYRISNLDKVLIKYRINLTGITINADKNKSERDRVHINIYSRAINNFGINPSKLDMEFHRYISSNETLKDLSELKKSIEYISCFILQLIERGDINLAILEKERNYQIFKMLEKSAPSLGLTAFYIFLTEYPSLIKTIPFVSQLKFFFKCIVRKYRY